MGKLNIKPVSRQTENYEGGRAFKFADPKLKLYSMASTWLVGEPKFYSEDGESNQDKEIIALIKQLSQSNPEFVCKLAVYCREKLYLRSAPVVLLVHAAINSQGIVRRYVPRIITRADQLTDVVSYLKQEIGDIGSQGESYIPMSLKRGLADAFANFDDYQFAKYNNQRRTTWLRDVLRIVHPKPANSAMNKIYKQIAEDTLMPPQTWENVISNEGSNKETWTKVLPKMGYMGVLRNLRNFVQNDVDEKPIIEILTNVNKIRNSKQFPYRFYSAWRVLAGMSDKRVPKLMDACTQALDVSCSNVPTLRGTSFITADVSGSMKSNVSRDSIISYADISTLFLAIANRICEYAITSVFADNHALINLPQSNGTIANMQAVQRVDVGYSTNAYLTVRHLLDTNTKVDRIILFSDMQCYDSYWGVNNIHDSIKEYRRRVNPDTFVYSIDLAGYGTLQIPEGDPKTCLISGWSDKILQYIPRFEESKDNALNEINSITV